MIMNKKDLPSPLDAALAHVDSDRRKFLGMLLAGVAAAPLLTSSDLVAENKPVTDKNATWTKGGNADKYSKADTVKSSGSKSDFKSLGKEGTLDNKMTVKAGPAAGVKSSGSKSDIKYWRNEGTVDKYQTFKSLQPAEHKQMNQNNNQMKYSKTQTVKSSQTIK
jgi:hypothetical protein